MGGEGWIFLVMQNSGLRVSRWRRKRRNSQAESHKFSTLSFTLQQLPNYRLKMFTWAKQQMANVVGTEEPI